MTVLNIYHFKGYPKPLKSKLYNQTVFLFYDNKEDAQIASEVAKSKWNSIDPMLKHPSYCSLGIGEIEHMSNGEYCVHIP